MSQTEKTPELVLFEAMFGGDITDWDYQFPSRKEEYRKGAAAVIAHHEAGKVDEVATLRARVAELENGMRLQSVAIAEYSSILAGQDAGMHRAKAQIAELEAQLAERRAVVPEYPDVMVRQSLSETQRHAGILEGIKWARKNVRAIDPATEEVVARERLENLIDSSTALRMAAIMNHWVGSLVDDVEKDCAALREGRA